MWKINPFTEFLMRHNLTPTDFRTMIQNQTGVKISLSTVYNWTKCKTTPPVVRALITFLEQPSKFGKG